MEPDEVLELVRELVNLSKLKTSKLQKDRAHELMGQLMDCGFSSLEVSQLVKRKWSDSTIRKYGKKLGGGDTSGKDQLIELIANYASVGGNAKDLQGYKKAKERAVSSGFKTFDELMVALDEIKEAGGAKSLSELASELAKAGDVTIKEIRDDHATRRRLDERGLTQNIQLKILEASEGHSPEELLEGVKTYVKIVNLRERKTKLTIEVDELEKQQDELLTESNETLDKIKNAKALIPHVKLLEDLGYTDITLTLLEGNTRKYGGPKKVFEAFDKYASVKEIEDEKIELEKLCDNYRVTIEKSGPRAKKIEETLERGMAMNDELVRIQTMYQNDSDYRSLADLIGDPEKITLKPEEVARLLYWINVKGAQYYNIRPGLEQGKLLKKPFEDLIAELRRNFKSS